MLDELLEIFDRDRKARRPGPKQGGIRGMLSRLSGDDDHSDDYRRYADDDRRYDDRRERERAHGRAEDLGRYDDERRRIDDDGDRRYDDDRRHTRRDRDGFDFFDD